jgi:hypothetical protein
MIEFAVEPLGRAQPDIESLIPAQWVHTGDPGIECRPNWHMYHQFADHGALMVVMARELDVPVGYLAAFIYPHPNAMQHTVAEIPTYYVANRPTRALIMSRMVDFTIEQLAARGVYKLKIETNAEHSAGRLWELKGFKVAKIGYSLQLARPAGEQNA